KIGEEQFERVARVDAPVPDLAVEVGGAGDRLGERLGLHVGERDDEAVPGAPGGDVAAHGAGADDVHAPRRPATAGETLELLAQEKHAHEVARSLSDKKAGKRSAFRALHVLRIASPRLP